MSTTITEDQKKAAISYLLSNQNDRPDKLKGLFSKLDNYGEKGSSLEKSINQTNQSLNKLYESMSELRGSINAVMEIITEGLDNDKIIEFAQKAVESLNGQKKEDEEKEEEDDEEEKS